MPLAGYSTDRTKVILSPSSLNYPALIKTAGIKAEIDIRCQLAFLYRSPFKKLYYHEPIELGKGVDFILTSLIHVTWASFKGASRRLPSVVIAIETSGGVLLIGFPLGLAAGISVVRGGVLNPGNYWRKKIISTICEANAIAFASQMVEIIFFRQ